MPKLILYILLFCASALDAQKNWCGAAQYEGQKNEIVYQEILERLRAFELHPAIHSRTIRNVQVVIHVVAGNGYHPVTQAQVLEQLDVLNNDFAGHGENILKLLPTFSSLVEDAQIHFCLAQFDPDGQPTSGITFTSTDTANIGLVYGYEGRRIIHYDELGGKSGWDPSRYINIWVGEMDDVLGTATMPGEVIRSDEIGLVIDIRHFGSFGDAGYYNSFGRGHTLTHEMGHFLGLRHIWGSGLGENCSDSDDIEDTPNAAGPYYGCPTGEQFSCDVSNMYQNFMDLTDDRCLAAFTRDQTIRMNSVLDLIYPGVSTELSCQTQLSSFPDWFDGLIWSTDPGSDKIIVYSPDSFTNTRTIRVFSMDGRLVLENKWIGNLATLINLQGVPSGVYLVHFTSGDESRSRKIVIY